jgi:hypothetical protein
MSFFVEKLGPLPGEPRPQQQPQASARGQAQPARGQPASQPQRAQSKAAAPPAKEQPKKEEKKKKGWF